MKITRSDIILPLGAFAYRPSRRLRIAGDPINETISLWQETDLPETRAFFDDLPEDAELEDVFARLVRLVAERVS